MDEEEEEEETGDGAEEAGPTSELLFRRTVRVDDVGRALLQGLQSRKERSAGDPRQDAAPGVTVKDRAVPWQGPVRTEAPVRPAGPSAAARRTATELRSFRTCSATAGRRSGRPWKGRDRSSARSSWNYRGTCACH